MHVSKFTECYSDQLKTASKNRFSKRRRLRCSDVKSAFVHFE